MTEFTCVWADDGGSNTRSLSCAGRSTSRSESQALRVTSEEPTANAVNPNLTRLESRDICLVIFLIVLIDN